MTSPFPHVDSIWKAKSPPYQTGFLIWQHLYSAGATEIAALLIIISA
jgi:hypothetical protein